MDTTSISVVVTEDAPVAEFEVLHGLFSEIEEDREPEMELLSDMLAENGVFFVDNSGSTCGAILRSEATFTQHMHPRQTALWNSSTSVRLQDTNTVKWSSEGGTRPSNIYCPGNYPDPPQEWTSFGLLTDGEVGSDEVRNLSQHSHKTSHLPSILGIALGSGNRPISACNVSVLFSHFTAARTAIIVTMDAENVVRVIRTKGCWEHSFGVLPELSVSAMLFDFPQVDVETLCSLRCTRGTMQPPNTVLVNASSRPCWLHLERLLSLSAFQSHVLEGRISEEEMEDIVRSFHARGRLSELRHWLVGISASLDVDARRSEEEAASAAAAAASAAEGESPATIAVLLSRLRHAKDASEREVVKAQLLSCAGNAQAAAASEKESKKKEQRSTKQLVSAGLRAACALEKAGMGADALGRLSNRAARAKKVDAVSLKKMAELETSGAPCAECNVMLDEGPCALLIRRVSQEIAEENTGDFALDFPLVVGVWQRNDIFCPDVIGTANGTADQIEASQSTVLGREDLVVALPIVPLSSEANRQELFLRLALAFNNGIALGAVWQVALSSILNVLETKPWAAPETAAGALLEYLGAEIMANVQLSKGTRLAMERDTTMNEAFAQALATRDFTQDYPIEGTVTAASALLRWGAPVAATPATYTAAVIARAHRAVPQQFLNWMKSDRPDGLPGSTRALWHAIYETRLKEDGSAVPIAGGHHLPTTWEGVLTHDSCLSLDRWARVLAVAQDDPNAANATANSLIRPGLAVVIRACLVQMTNRHISSQAAVELAERFHQAVSLEFTPSTVGTTTSDEALGILAEWLLWARCPMRPLPPFATQHGPSLLFFYHCRTRNGLVTDMTTGFQWNIDCGGETESETARMERLAAHVKQSRGSLLSKEFDFNRDGTFKATTNSVPMYRAMTHEWCLRPDVDPLDGAFVNAVVARILAEKKGNVHIETLEHDVAMLAPSLKAVGRLSAMPGRQWEQVQHAGVIANIAGLDYSNGSPDSSLASRLRAELAGRTTDEICCEDAPATIWVPRDDPDLRARLRAADAATQQRLRAVQEELTQRAALLPARVPSSVSPVKKLQGMALERFITKLLRHEAEKRGLTVRPDGYVEVERILEMDCFHGVSLEEFLGAAIESQMATKRRFQAIEENGCLLVRAVQGHTMAAVRPDALMQEITDPDEVPICIHGTYEKAFEMIQKSDLNRMSRNEIQMAVGLPDDPEVTSGVRQNVEVLIYVDVARAMGEGLRFFRSANNVICSPGPIPPSCFAHVVHRSTAVALLPSSFNRNAAGIASASAPSA